MPTAIAFPASNLRPNFFYGLLFILFSLALSACGGGGGGGGGGTVVGGGGIGGTGSVAAIASITVNGVTYSCVGTTLTDDDGTFDQGSGDRCVAARDAGRLSVGSIVTVTGTTDGAGNATATTVNISRSVRGPVANLNVTGQSFSVLGQTILVDQTTHYAGVASLSGLGNGTIVEVGGFRQPATGTLPNGAILASLVKTTTAPSGESELKGMAIVNAGAVTINGISIVLLSGQQAPTSGQCVEAKGTFSGNTLTLTQALKADDDCTGASPLTSNLNQAQVEGVITAFNSLADFSVGGQAVNGGSANILGGLAGDLLNGVKVEVKGTLSDGKLNATQIEIKSNGVRIEGTTDTGLSGGSFTILGITVKVVTGTENPLGNFGAGTRLRVEGSKADASIVNASKISNASGGGGGGGTRTELRGPLDANPISPNFTILTVPVQTSGSTQFNGSTSNAATFFANTKKDEIVKARGTENTNDVITADEVENED